LLLRDILREDPQVMAAAQTIAAAGPDVLLLTGFDFDHEGRALAALTAMLAGMGAEYPHLFARRPNSGMATGLDMDGDGRRRGARDAQGYGRFAGQGGMAVLSKFPIRADQARDFSGFLWRDLPGADLPEIDGAPFPSVAAMAAQRLSSVAHWVVPVDVPGGATLPLLAFSATPPVFDGFEDGNGRRNHDEAAFWLRHLAGDLAALGPDLGPPMGPVVLLGKINIDPALGEGRRDALSALLHHPRLRDPRPRGADGRDVTVDWPGDTDEDRAAGRQGPGDMRVSYVLPDRALRVIDAGVFWPAPGQPLAETVARASAHRLVWVDVALP
jgi:hypothetical protein